MISVVIPGLNEEENIEECLKSVKRQNYSKEFEIIVADNGSVDRTREIAEKYCDEMLAEPKLSLAELRNKDISRSKGDVIALTDADCIVSNWLKEAAKSLQDYDLVSGSLVPIESSNLHRLSHYIFCDIFLTFAVNRLGFSNAVGGNCAFYKDLAEKVGGFKDSLPSDGRFGLEVGQIGKIFHNPEMRVYASVRRFESKSSVRIFVEMIEAHSRLRWGNNKRLKESYYRK